MNYARADIQPRIPRRGTCVLIIYPLNAQHPPFPDRADDQRTRGSASESNDSFSLSHSLCIHPSAIARGRLVVVDPGCSLHQKFALSCSDSLIPERLGPRLARVRATEDRGRRMRRTTTRAGGRQRAAGGAELGVIGAAVCMKVSTRCDIGARPALLFARRKSSGEPTPPRGAISPGDRKPGPVEK